MTGHELADLLDAHGFDFFTGVPCSLAEGLIAALECDPHGRRAPYIPAVREDIALGLAAGAWLGGRLYDTTGSYDLVWWIAAALGIFAALINLPVRETPIVRPRPELVAT